MAKLIECKPLEFISRADLERAPNEGPTSARERHSPQTGTSAVDDYSIDERWYAATTRKKNDRPG